MSVFYGQKHSKELDCADKVAKFYKISHKVIDLSNSGIMNESNCPLLTYSTEKLNINLMQNRLQRMEKVWLEHMYLLETV